MWLNREAVASAPDPAAPYFNILLHFRAFKVKKKTEQNLLRSKPSAEVKTLSSSEQDNSPALNLWTQCPLMLRNRQKTGLESWGQSDKVGSAVSSF